jgi:hypothetical protein
MTARFSPLIVAVLCVLACQQKVDAFAGQSMVRHNINTQPFVSRSAGTSTMKNTQFSSVTTMTPSTTSLNAFSGGETDMLLSATTLDPTTFFQNILGLFLNTPIILAVPIVAALGVAGTLVWLIVAYASPAEEN